VVHLLDASELKPVKNSGEEGARAYPGTAQFFWVPLHSFLICIHCGYSYRALTAIILSSPGGAALH